MTTESLAQWNTLFARWKEANQKARDSRGMITMGYANASLGNGQVPSPSSIDNALELERIADTLAVELDNFARLALRIAAIEKEQAGDAGGLDPVEIPAWVRPRPTDK